MNVLRAFGAIGADAALAGSGWFAGISGRLSANRGDPASSISNAGPKLANRSRCGAGYCIACWSCASMRVSGIGLLLLPREARETCVLHLFVFVSLNAALAVRTIARHCNRDEPPCRVCRQHQFTRALFVLVSAGHTADHST